MNYIELINNFWASDWSYNFNSIEIALYFSILNHANKARWPESFTLPNSVLLISLKCTKDHLIRARRRLCKAGLIKYRNGDRFNPGKYTIIAHLSPTRELPDTFSKPTQDLPTPDLSEASCDKQQNGVEREPDLLKTYPTPTQDLPEAFPMPASNINKTKLNKTKQEDSISPYGETKTLFSNPRGEMTEDCPLRIEIFEVERETALHSGSMDKSIERVSSETSPALEALSSGEEKTFPVGKGEGELSRRQDQREIVGISAIEQTEEEVLEFVEYDSCSKFERDVMETWEVLIGPFESHWVPLLRETLTKCYPSQVKNAIIAIDRSKHEVLMERGFEYLMQPLLNGTFGRRVKKNGRNDWHGSGSFRDPIEKFKNPAKEKPKTREELLKYTQY